MDSYPHNNEYPYRLHVKSGERAMTEKSSNRVRKACLFSLIAVMTVWNIVLHVQTTRHSQKIHQLELKNLQLSERFMDAHGAFGPHRVKHSVEMTEAQIDTIKDNGNIDEIENVSRDTGSTSTLREKRAAPRREGKYQKRNRQINNNKQKKNKSKSGPGAHFVAYVDDDKLTREIAADIEPRIGRRDANGGLIPNDNIYRFWKPTSWSSKRKFAFDEGTGKVTIKDDGYYLVYGQIVFHGAAARKSYGIHINDELTPFVESIAFDNIRELRKKRDVSSLNHPLGNSTEHHQGHRDKRSGQYSSYSQCNTVAVAYIEANSTVFLKSVKSGRSIITESYLTFWGLAKL